MKVDRDSYAFKSAEKSLIGDLNLEAIDFNAFPRQNDAVEYILQQLLLLRTRNMGGYTSLQLLEMRTSTYLGIPVLELADNIVIKNRTVVDCDTNHQGLWYDPNLAAEITATAQQYLVYLSNYQREQITKPARDIQNLLAPRSDPE